MLLLPAGLTAANADSHRVVADWQMSDDAGTEVMFDSSGNRNHGVISKDAAADGLSTGVDFTSEDTGYRWGSVRPNVDIKPGRVVRASSSALNPGTRDWAISFRYRTDRPYGNIIQKGQSQAKGGQIKFQLPRGQVSCMFKDGSGVRRSIKTLKRYDDYEWHVVKCVRTGAGVTLTVDEGTSNAERRFIRGSSGSISNTVPMTVGGKPNCDQIEITCDYFEGDIDWVTVEDLS